MIVSGVARGDRTAWCQRPWILPHIDDSLRSMLRRYPRRTPVLRRHRSKHTGKSLKKEVDVSCDSRVRIDLDAIIVVPDRRRIVFKNPEVDSAPGVPAHHRGDGTARRAHRHHSRINRWRNTVSASRTPRRRVERAARPSRQRINVEDRRTGMMQIRPIRALPVGCSSS